MAIYNIGVKSVRTEPNEGGNTSNTSFETSFEILRHWKADVGVAMRGQEVTKRMLEEGTVPH